MSAVDAANVDVRIVQRYVASSYMCTAAGGESNDKGALYYEALAAMARLVLPYVERERGQLASLRPARVMKILRASGVQVMRAGWKCTGFWKLVGTFAAYVTRFAGPIPGWRYSVRREDLVEVLRLASHPDWWRYILRDAFVTPRKRRRLK